MAAQFPTWEVTKFKEAFLKIDVNGDGTITTKELSSLLNELGQHVSVTTLKNMMQEFDADKNGTIEFHEFLEMLSRDMVDTDFDEKMNKEFRSFDKERIGYITAAQLRTAMATNCDTVTDGEFDEWLRDKHIEDNDKIEYKRFFQRKKSIQEMPTQFSSNQLTMYKEAFSQFDVNNDGTITIDELQNLMKKLGIHPSEKGLQNMIDEVDINGNGIIDYLEFLTMMACKIGDDTDFEKTMDREFRQYDKNNEGYVTVAELRVVLGRFCDTMTVGEFDEFLHDSNMDDNDRISYKQYFSRSFSTGNMEGFVQ